MKTCASCSLALVVIATLSCAEGDRGDVPVPPRRGAGPAVVAASPVSLTAGTVDEFLAWAGGVGTDQRETVRDSIHRARGDQTVLDSLFSLVDRYYTQDVTASLVLLSIIGELRDPSGAGQLQRIISRPLPESQEVHGGLSERDLVEMIQSKAVESLAYLRTEEADRMVLEVVSRHPSAAVRSAAADAYLFNHDDSERAKEQLRQFIRRDEAFFLDRVRRNAITNPREFDEGLALFYTAYPDYVAPEPDAPADIGDHIAPPSLTDQPRPSVRGRKDNPR